jgi:ABC-type uncharacterized transport system permease subunit
VIHLVAFAVYLAAFILWLFLLVRGPGRAVSQFASAITAVAVALHAAALVGFWLDFRELPIVGLGAVLSSLAFVGGLGIVALVPLRDVARIAIGLLPFVLLLQGTALVVGIEPSPTSLDFQGVGFVLHVALAFLGLQGLAVAAAAGVLYLIQHHELKVKRLGRVFVFIPPLATLERVGRVGLQVGFACLSLALAVGWAWTVQNRSSLEFGDPKVMWAVTSWLVFVGVLGVRQTGGHSEHRSALAAVIGFGIVVGTYLALRLTAGGSGLFL